MRTLTAMALGGAIVYFLDPVSGRERRARALRTADSLLDLGQRAAQETGRPQVADAIARIRRVAGVRTEANPVVVSAQR